MKIPRLIMLAAAAIFALGSSTATTAQSKTAASKGHAAVTGCLSGPNSEGAYVLKPAKGHAFEVGGNDELKSHVGHTVKLTGSWAKSGAEIGENESAEKNEKSERGEHAGVAERHLKVTAIQHISDSCSQTTASTKMKH